MCNFGDWVGNFMISSAKINKNKSNNSSCFSSCSWEIIVDMAVSLELRGLGLDFL